MMLTVGQVWFSEIFTGNDKHIVAAYLSQKGSAGGSHGGT